MVVECELVVAGQLFLEPRSQVKALHKNVIEALVITGNKSKGQSLIMAGIGLREECFSHGQFYVAYVLELALPVVWCF
ncbi:ATP-dependent DNA helicase RRM3-like [Aphis craccivora]|uniref:ATP-dependent DNA helicase RRM3-like n=1 Tax=Aphis craccivora TaxID=307492 RepID=A0A6G0ZJK2_APHCR|nr:ATP-dependent DNA helicase RRM3-like [Aphis craccivora]